MSCDHENFVADVAVNRLTTDEGGPVTGYSADVRVRCLDCDEPFVFIGVPVGCTPRFPAASLTGDELRAPIRPASAPAGWGEDGPGMVMTDPLAEARKAN